MDGRCQEDFSKIVRCQLIDSREERQRMRRTKMMISRGCCFVLVEIRFLISDGHIEIGHGSFSLEKMVPFYYEREKKNVLMPRSLNLHGELFELLVNLAVNVVQLLPFCYCYTSYFFFLFLLVMCYGCVLVFLVVRKTLSKCQRVTNWI